ncbi:ankyrin repeat-containing domain protein [Morchella snyderi]|nr:ankyrin repeat-containing domain protein [Morchella snyderi]
MEKLLFRAARRGKPRHHTLLTLLLRSGAINVNAADAHGHTALHRACHAGHHSIVLLLLAHGASATAATRRTRQTPLHRAVAGRLEPALLGMGGEELAELGAGEGRGGERRDREGVEGVVRALLGAGADVDAADARGRTVLHEAVWGGDVAMVRLLVRCGARGDLKDREGNTAVGMARCGGCRGVRELLVGVEEGVEGENGEKDP